MTKVKVKKQRRNNNKALLVLSALFLMVGISFMSSFVDTNNSVYSDDLDGILEEDIPTNEENDLKASATTVSILSPPNGIWTTQRANTLKLYVSGEHCGPYFPAFGGAFTYYHIDDHPVSGSVTSSVNVEDSYINSNYPGPCSTTTYTYNIPSSSLNGYFTWKGRFSKVWLGWMWSLNWWETWSDTNTIYYDLEAPTNLQLNVPSGWTTDNTPTITYYGNAGYSGLDYYEIWIGSYLYYRGKNTVYTFPSLGNGYHTVKLRVKDNAGNWAETARTIRIDYTAPPTPYPNDGLSGWSTDNTPTFSWSRVSDISGITGYYWKVDGGSEYWTTSNVVTLPAQSDGTHTFLVRARNGAGLMSSYGGHSFSIDSTDPSTPNPNDGVDGWSTDKTPTFTWSATDVPSGVAGYYWKVDSGPEIWTTSTSVTLPTQSNGIHTFSVVTKDNAGNLGDWGSHTFQIMDEINPPNIINAELYPNTQVYDSSGVTQIRIWVTDESDIQSVWVIFNGENHTATLSPDGLYYTYNIDISNILDVYTYGVRAVDEYYNEAYTEFNFTIEDDDTEEPEISIRYDGDYTKDNPGCLYVNASDASGLSVDPSGVYNVSSDLGTYYWTFEATDNDNDRPGDSLTNILNYSITIGNYHLETPTLTRENSPLILNQNSSSSLWNDIKALHVDNMRIAYYSEENEWQLVPFQLDEKAYLRGFNYQMGYQGTLSGSFFSIHVSDVDISNYGQYIAEHRYVGKDIDAQPGDPYKEPTLYECQSGIWATRLAENWAEGSPYPAAPIQDWREVEGGQRDQIEHCVDWDDELVFYAEKGYKVSNNLWWNAAEYPYRYEIEIIDPVDGGQSWMYIYYNDDDTIPINTDHSYIPSEEDDLVSWNSGNSVISGQNYEYTFDNNLDLGSASFIDSETVSSIYTEAEKQWISLYARGYLSYPTGTIDVSGNSDIWREGNWDSYYNEQETSIGYGITMDLDLMNLPSLDPNWEINFPGQDLDYSNGHRTIGMGGQSHGNTVDTRKQVFGIVAVYEDSADHDGNIAESTPFLRGITDHSMASNEAAIDGPCRVIIDKFTEDYIGIELGEEADYEEICKFSHKATKFYSTMMTEDPIILNTKIDSPEMTIDAGANYAYIAGQRFTDAFRNNSKASIMMGRAPNGVAGLPDLLQCNSEGLLWPMINYPNRAPYDDALTSDNGPLPGRVDNEPYYTASDEGNPLGDWIYASTGTGGALTYLPYQEIWELCANGGRYGYGDVSTYWNDNPDFSEYSIYINDADLNGRTGEFIRATIFGDFDEWECQREYARIKLNLEPSFTKQNAPEDLLPIADFIVSDTNIIEGDPIAFTFTGSYGDIPVSYIWDFGDGFNSTLENPVHIYNYPETYTVSLTVIDDDGDIDTEIKTDFITVSDDDSEAPTITIEYFGNFSDGDPGYLLVSASDNVGLSVDPSGVYDVSNELGLQNWTFIAVDNDNDCPGDALTTIVNYALFITDDDTEAPTIYVGYDGDYTDVNPGNVHVNATDNVGLSVDPSGVYSVPSDPGIYSWTFIAVDNDSDRPGDNMTTISEFSVTIYDDDNITPEIYAQYIGDYTDRDAGYILVNASDNRGLSVDPTGIYYLDPTIINTAQEFTFIATDNDNDRADDSITTIETMSITLTDDDTEAPEIFISYSGDYTDNNPGYIFVYATDNTGLSVDPSGNYSIPSEPGTYYYTFIATDSDDDRPGDSLTNVINISITIIDDDTEAPEIFLSYDGDYTDNNPGCIYVNATDNVGLSVDPTGIYTVPSEPGTYYWTFIATDNDDDRADDSLSTIMNISVTITDDDTTAPVIFVEYIGGSTDGDPGYIIVNASDNIELSIDPSGTYALDPSIIGIAQEFTFTATDNDNDRAGDSLTTVETISIILTDDDTEAPVIYISYDGDYTDGNPGNVYVNASDNVGLSVDPMGIYPVSAELGTYYWTFIATDNDDDREGDSLTTVMNFSITITDDDTIAPVIVVEYVGGGSDGEAGYVQVTASDNIGLSIDPSGTYALDPSIIGIAQEFTFTATDNDNDRAGDSLTTVETISMILTDDDTEAPVIYISYDGDYTDGNPGNVYVNASDNIGLSIDPTGIYPVSAELGTYYWTFTATDNDDDREGDSLTTVMNFSITITDDDTIAPVIVVEYVGGSTDGDAGYVQVTASDNIGLSVDPSGTYALDPSIIGTAQEFTFSATDNDDDRADDSLTTIESISITLTDDDITAPEIFVSYDGDYTDANPGVIYVNATDVSGLSVDPTGTYTVPSLPGIYNWTFIATDADADRAGDSLTTEIYYEIIIIDDDTIFPSINEVLIETPILNNASSLWVKVDATDASGIESVIVIFDVIAYTAIFDGAYYYADLDMGYLGDHIISIIVTDADDDVPDDGLISIETYTISIADGLLDQTTITIDVVSIELNHEMAMGYGFDVTFSVFADQEFNDHDYDIEVSVYDQVFNDFGNYQIHIPMLENYGTICTITNTLGESITESKDIIIDEAVVKALILKQLDEINDLIDASDASDWSKKNYQKTMINKINALIHQIINGEYDSAYDKLLHDLKPLLTGLKTDEWETAWGDGGVYNNPWVSSDTLQETFQYEINPTLWALTQIVEL